MEQEEIWKPVVGWEQFYEVSNLGRVRRILTKDNVYRTLSQRDNHGYRQVHLKRPGKNKQMQVHRLVAMAFIPNAEGKNEIDHIDANRTNNKVENLRWCTQIENRNNPITAERHRLALWGRPRPEYVKLKISKANKGKLAGEKHPHYGKKFSEETRRKLSESHKGLFAVKIVQLDSDGNFVREWPSLSSVHQSMGISTGHITDCCRGRKRTAHGYKWKYLSDYEQEKKG